MSISTASVIMLTGEQEEAMSAIDAFMADPSRQVFNLHGLAGVGKTFLLQHVAEQYDHAALCSLTGKAASILRRRTGMKACTLHSFFYRLTEVRKDKRGRDVPTFERRYDRGDLADKLALIDESSMINEEIARDLLATGCKIIACGDPGQLPPVKGTQFFSRPDFLLRTIHRQALDSPIIRQAHAVRSGGTYADDGPCFRVIRGGSDNDLREADVVLCWTNKTKDKLNSMCRRVRGFWQPGPQPGEPLVCLKNAAEYGTFNGGVYILLKPFLQADTDITLDVDGTAVTIPQVRFSGLPGALPEGAEVTTTFDFGYAMTVHKSQGSEWPFVVLCDEYRKTEQRKEWVYTAITRASERILVVR